MSNRLFAGITTAGIAANRFRINSKFVSLYRGTETNLVIILRAIVFNSDQGGGSCRFKLPAIRDRWELKNYRRFGLTVSLVSPKTPDWIEKSRFLANPHFGRMGAFLVPYWGETRTAASAP